MSSVIHLSDTHFGTEHPAVEAALALKIEEIKPQAILLTGDITQRARRSQFRAARDFLGRFAAPALCIPGNHDIPLFNLLQRFVDPYRNYESFFSTREPLLHTERAVFLGLDATTPLRHKRGELNAEHVREKVGDLTRKLKSGVFLCLCVHQPILVYTKKDEKNLVIGAPQFVELFAALKIDLVLSGHIHLPLVSTTERWYPDLPWHLVFSGAGTCVSRRVRGQVPNSFNEISFSAAGAPVMTVRRHDFDPSLHTFSLHGETKFLRCERGWATEPSRNTMKNFGLEA